MDSIIADIFIVIGIIVLLATVVVTGCSIVKSQKVNKRPKRENGVPLRMIGVCTLAGVLAVAIPTLLIGSFTDACIVTSLTLLTVASVAVIYGRILTLRLRKRV